MHIDVLKKVAKNNFFHYICSDNYHYIFFNLKKQKI